MKQSSYLVAARISSMESRGEFTRWLKEFEAVNVFGDVWFLTAPYKFAGDLQYELERFREFDGQIIAVKLNEATDWTQKNLSDDASLWIRTNLG
jgi:hypothetical protein